MEGRSELLDHYLTKTVETGASDLHLHCNASVALRRHGKLVFEDEPPLNHRQLEKVVSEVVSKEHRDELFATGSCDFAYHIPGLARFRANFLLQHHGYGAVFRVVPSDIPSLEKLGLPEVLYDISKTPQGLVIVTGPTGSGKSTTLAAMIDYINSNTSKHIITIEDPIEFAHPSKVSMIQQRQVGVHAKSFAQALKAALREAPDIILVGEMRDLETVSQALAAAETGHLVFGTLHTNSAAKTIDRIIDIFPADAQDSIRGVLAGTLRAVVAQQLVPRDDCEGRVAVQEIMRVNVGISGLIREGKTSQIPSFITMGMQEGMQSMDHHLSFLCQGGYISRETAYARCHSEAILKRAGIEPPAPTTA